jgi:hypothetical protein
MRICEFIGILVVQCEKCGRRFVVNTEMIKDGFSMNCCRGVDGLLYDKVTVTLERQINYGAIIDKETLREYKFVVTHGQAMPLEEYKRLLADFIITGRKPKIKKEHSQVVNLDTNEQQYKSLFETLRLLGYSKEETFGKIDVALKEGLRMETEIIKYILSLQ